MFHVPEKSRVTQGPMGSEPDAGNFGAFLIESCEPGWMLALVCDDGLAFEQITGWEHVSVRAYALAGRNTQRSRIPTWKEMCQVKELCWGPEAVVMQLHPAKSQYVDKHPHVLHLWRPIEGQIPLPPKELV